MRIKRPITMMATGNMPLKDGPPTQVVASAAVPPAESVQDAAVTACEEEVMQRPARASRQIANDARLAAQIQNQLRCKDMRKAFTARCGRGTGTKSTKSGVKNAQKAASKPRHAHALAQGSGGSVMTPEEEALLEESMLSAIPDYFAAQRKHKRAKQQKHSLTSMRTQPEQSSERMAKERPMMRPACEESRPAATPAVAARKFNSARTYILGHAGAGSSLRPPSCLAPTDQDIDLHAAAGMLQDFSVGLSRGFDTEGADDESPEEVNSVQQAVSDAAAGIRVARGDVAWASLAQAWSPHEPKPPVKTPKQVKLGEFELARVLHLLCG